MKVSSNRLKLVSIVAASLLCSPYNGAQASEANEDSYFDLPLEELVDIVVTSVSKKEEKAFEAPAAIYVISQEDIRRSGATNIPEALRLAPGLQVARIDSNKWAISSRGFNRQFSNKLLVLIDGRSVYTPLFSGVYWDVQDTPLEDIERIEVIRGPGATLWGANAVNGVINIITKKAKETQGTLLSAGGGLHEQGFGTLRYGGKLTESNSYYRTYAKYNNFGEFERSNGVDANDSWDMSRAGFRYDSDQRVNDKVTVQGDVYEGRKDYPLINVPTPLSPYSVSYPNETEEFSGGNILTRWEKTVSDTSNTSLQFYYDFIRRDVSLIGQTRSTFDIDFQHDWYVNDRNQIVWGLGYRYITDNLEDSQQINYDVDSRNDMLWSAFLQDKITLKPEELFLTIGSKFERNDYTGFELQPSACLSWLVDDKQTLWSSVSRAVRTPSRNEDDIKLVNLAIPPGTLLGPGTPVSLASQIGNRNIESEEMLAYEIGYRIKPRNELILDFSAFYNEYDNLRTTESPATPFADLTLPIPSLVVPLPLANLGYGESYGFEVAANYNISNNWRIYANYTFLTMNLHLDGSSGDTTLQNDEGRSPKNQFHVRSYYNITEDVEWDNLFYYVDNLSTANIDTYMRFDTRIGWDVMDGVNLSLAAQNLFDDQHQEFNESIYSTPSEIGRVIYGKVTWKF
ncbi:MAG: TonB-dependent receptor [Hyphomicrobiales bacterium]|nr:TonB-dependent receptor [Hyphomicrobiales bacterium]